MPKWIQFDEEANGFRKDEVVLSLSDDEADSLIFSGKAHELPGAAAKSIRDEVYAMDQKVVDECLREFDIDLKAFKSAGTVRTKDKRPRYGSGDGEGGGTRVKLDVMHRALALPIGSVNWKIRESQIAHNRALGYSDPMWY